MLGTMAQYADLSHTVAVRTPFESRSNHFGARPSWITRGGLAFPNWGNGLGGRGEGGMGAGGQGVVGHIGREAEGKGTRGRGQGKGIRGHLAGGRGQGRGSFRGIWGI